MIYLEKVIISTKYIHICVLEVMQIHPNKQILITRENTELGIHIALDFRFFYR